MLQLEAKIRVRSKLFLRKGAGVLLAAATVLSIGSASAQDETKVRAGLEAWKTAGCAECHGAFADGEKQRDEAPSGANLRQSRLDNAALAETIRCGRPGTRAGIPTIFRGGGCAGTAR